MASVPHSVHSILRPSLKKITGLILCNSVENHSGYSQDHYDEDPWGTELPVIQYHFSFLLFKCHWLDSFLLEFHRSESLTQIRTFSSLLCVIISSLVNVPSTISLFVDYRYPKLILLPFDKHLPLHSVWASHGPGLPCILFVVSLPCRAVYGLQNTVHMCLGDCFSHKVRVALRNLAFLISCRTYFIFSSVSIVWPMKSQLIFFFFYQFFHSPFPLNTCYLEFITYIICTILYLSHAIVYLTAFFPPSEGGGLTLAPLESPFQITMLQRTVFWVLALLT